MKTSIPFVSSVAACAFASTTVTADYVSPADSSASLSSSKNSRLEIRNQSNAPASATLNDRKASPEGHWGGSLAGSEASQILFFRDYAIGSCAFGTVTFTSSPTTFAGLLASGTEHIHRSNTRGSAHAGPLVDSNPAPPRPTPKGEQSSEE